MKIVKELNSIALDITEPQYRQMPELSYSTLSTYMTLGYNGLDHLFDRKDSPSLTVGSAVDAWITGGEEEFKSLFSVVDIPSIGDKEKMIANLLYQYYAGTYKQLSAIPATYILNVANSLNFQKNWRDDTRVKVITERCSQYYTAKIESGSKTILDTKTFEDVQNMVRALKESPSTCTYFAENDAMSPIKRYYQLKFRAELKNVGYRCMADLLVTDYENKVIYPCDLKTSLSCYEWDFEQNFIKWHYFIQARLYWRIIRDNMDRDSYFKDFTLENYRFIIINPATLTPLVWEFPLTKEQGELITDDGEIIKDPLDIGKELRSYLDLKPPVPYGININGINTIRCIHKAPSINTLTRTVKITNY